MIFSNDADLSYRKKISLGLKIVFLFLLEESYAKEFACITLSLHSLSPLLKGNPLDFLCFFKVFIHCAMSFCGKV